MVERDQVVDRARIAPQRRRRRIVDRAEPAFVDQPADQRAGDRLGHRPARRRAIRRAECAVAFGTARDPARRSGCRRCPANWRTAHRARAASSAGGGARRLDGIAVRPGAARIGRAREIGTGSNRRRAARAEQDAAIAGPRDRRAGERRAECRIAPAHGGAAVGVVGLDGDVGRRGARRSAPPGRPMRRAAKSARRESPAARQRKCRSAVPRSRPLTYIMSAKRLAAKFTVRWRMARGEPSYTTGSGGPSANSCGVRSK